jgi:sulfur transfer complex TusBCD TusB component (DsrH family)
MVVLFNKIDIEHFTSYSRKRNSTLVLCNEAVLMALSCALEENTLILADDALRLGCYKQLVDNGLTLINRAELVELLSNQQPCLTIN